MFIPSSNSKCGQNKSLFYFFLVWGLKASSLVYFSSVFIASFPPSMLNFLPFPFHRGFTSQLTLNFDRELLVVIIVCPDDPPTTFKRVRNFYFVAILYFVYWPAYHITGQYSGKWLTWNICMGYRVFGMGYWVLSIHIQPPFNDNSLWYHVEGSVVC